MFELTKYGKDVRARQTGSYIRSMTPLTPDDQDSDMADAPPAEKAMSSTPSVSALTDSELDLSSTGDAYSESTAPAKVSESEPKDIAWLQGTVLDQAKGPPPSTQRSNVD